MEAAMDVQQQQLESWWLCITAHFPLCSSSMFWVVLSGLFLVVLLHVSYAHFRPHHFDRLPPGPSPLPVLGNLHQLLKPCPHHALANLAKQHGPLMCLFMGSRRTLFISTGAMAKMFFQSSDRHFASRPGLAFCNRLLYGQDNGVAFSVYGPRWRKMRRVCMIELFTTKRIHSFQSVLEEELELLVKELYILCGRNKGAVELNVAHLAHLIVSSMMGRLVLSKRMCDIFVNGESLLDMFKKTNDAIVPAVGDFIHHLGHLLDLKNTRNMDRVHKHIDSFWKAILQERHKHREAHPKGSSSDFLDVLLSNDEVIELGDDNIKATLMDILGAGSETSAITIEWAMAELLQSPHCFAKLQMELDAVCPRKPESVSQSASLSSASPAPSFQLPWQNILSSSSSSLLSSPYPVEKLSPCSSSSSSLSPPPLWLPSLPPSSTMISTSTLSSLPSPCVTCTHIAQVHYLKAVVKETLRLHPPVPLLIPRESTGSACDAMGYTFPVNTMLFVNAWAIGRDGEAWEEAEVFRPDRFTRCIEEMNGGGSMDLRNDYRMLPFGAGRRMCPGMGLALCIMELTIATLVQAFHWKLPDGYVLEMSEKSGNAGTHKAKPLIAILTPR